MVTWVIFNHMVEYYPSLNDVFHSLANPTRRDILRRLSPHEQTVGELAEHYSLTFAAVSKHLRVLERAKLIRKRRSGREQKVQLFPQGLEQANKYLEQYRGLWEEKLDQLEVFLKNNK
jgi:DNA-binding transcriptional ArsR family regulator